MFGVKYYKFLYRSRTLVVALTILFTTKVFAQKHDFNWMMGYDAAGNTSDTFNGGVQLNFEDWALEVSSVDSPIYNMGTMAISGSDVSGNLGFFSNGIEIWNGALDTMKNSEDFNISEYQDWYVFGMPQSQGGLFLPQPDSDSLYYIFHLKMGLEIQGSRLISFGDSLFYTVVDMTGDSGLGIVLEVNIPISVERFYFFGLTATKHANGRDWWILMPELNSNRYWTFLLDPTGVKFLFVQEVGELLPKWFSLGESVFSPDGKWYIRNSASTNGRGPYLDIYRFDRITGRLSSHLQFIYSGDGYAGGVSISPNSRFVYVNQGLKMYQFDLKSVDIESSKLLIDEYDGFDDLGFKTTFYQSQLASDGKIYLASTNGHRYLHVIHDPNKKGVGCTFKQHDIMLPRANVHAIPNNPNYRLGPIDGSVADTLGIDNIPLAVFHYQSRWRDVDFIDNSFYEPTNWSWTFGDGMTSADTSPTHVYTDTGTYHVCLTVSNVYGADTFCRDVRIIDSLSVTLNTPLFDEGMFVNPNPASEMINLKLPTPLASGFRWELYSIAGCLIQTEAIHAGETSQIIRLNRLPNGVYLWRLTDGVEATLPKKIVILRNQDK